MSDYTYLLRNKSNINYSNVVGNKVNDYTSSESNYFFSTTQVELSKQYQIDTYLKELWGNYRDSGVLKKDTNDDALRLWSELKATFGVDGLYPSVSMGASGTIMFTFRYEGTYLEIEIEDEAYSVYYKYKGDPSSDGLKDFPRNEYGLKEAVDFASSIMLQTA
jgi:hypothetical protein